MIDINTGVQVQGPAPEDLFVGLGICSTVRDCEMGNMLAPIGAFGPIAIGDAFSYTSADPGFSTFVAALQDPAIVGYPVIAPYVSYLNSSGQLVMSANFFQGFTFVPSDATISGLTMTVENVTPFSAVGGDYSQGAVDVRYTLTGTNLVSEPSTLLLLGFGVLGLALLRSLTLLIR